MTQSVVVQTRCSDSAEAGADLGRQISLAFGGQDADAVVLFASPRHEYRALLGGLKAECEPGNLIGCSSAGEYTHEGQTVGSACAIALRSDDMKFHAGLGRGMRTNPEGVAQGLVTSFQGVGNHRYPYRTALVLTDALSGHAEDLVEHLNVLTAGQYQLFGGGAADDARFQATHVFYGREAYADAVVALEILSLKPLGIGAGHGWEPASAAMRVTASDGRALQSLNAVPVLDVFEEYAHATGQTFDRADPAPFFIHNVLGIRLDGGYKIRVPLQINDDSSVTCAAEVPMGSTVHIMRVRGGVAEAAERATQMAIQQLGGAEPGVAVVLECVATHVRNQQDNTPVLRAVENGLGQAPYAGFNTIGQIVRAGGQFSGFHNCSAVVCVIPS